MGYALTDQLREEILDHGTLNTPRWTDKRKSFR